MERCPFCGSEDIYFSKKRKIFVCEDCDRTFSEQSSDEKNSPAAGEGLELFFSYGHDRNRLLVERIKRDLEKRGHHVWLDTSEIKAGDHWRDDILHGVLNASSVIAFLSEYSTRRPGVCLDELKIAVCVRGADIKTVLLEPENRIQPPATLSDIQWLDMSDWYEIKNSADADFEQWYRQKFSELCQVIESRETVELSGEIHVLKTMLLPYLNSEKEYQLLSREFYGRKWLEMYIEDWQDRRTEKALVIYGKPGSGKSAFSVNYSHYNSDVYGCFLCEWNREYTINPGRFIRTMAFRLASKLPDYRSMLLRQLEESPCLDEMDAEELFDFLLTYPLSHLIDGNRETGIILVDGLDEAEKDGCNPLAQVLADCIERLPRWIKFVFTSRPEKSVSKYYQSFESIDIVKDMPKGYNDIMAYLIKTLAEELRRISNKLEVLNRICELSEGIFLYAELLVEDIKNGIISLNDIDVFPRGLNAFYRLSMERKFADREAFQSMRSFLEVLSVEDFIPEKLLCGVCGYTRYQYLIQLDRIGSWLNRYEEDGICLLGFSHKSVRDWFTSSAQSGRFYVDSQEGALRLARYCRSCIENKSMADNAYQDERLRKFIRNHTGLYYVASGQYKELEEFLLLHQVELDPFWNVWNQFPNSWDYTKMLEAFWLSEGRNAFLQKLQREGNTEFLLWIFEKAGERYGIQNFDEKLAAVYIDIVHLSGEYSRAVDIASQYLKDRGKEAAENEFLAMLSVRKIHNSMFYRPAGRLLDEAMALYARLDERFPYVYNELLFLIGGNLGVLFGDWELAETWLEKSEAFAELHQMTDFRKRNARKKADCCCQREEYEKAEQILSGYLPADRKITGRYEAYLTGALANVYTCIGRDDDAIECYERVLKYASDKGIAGWTAHANLGIANINFKLGNLKEAVDFAGRANEIYRRIRQEWGMIMSGALLAACESRVGIAPMRVACDKALRRAEKMQYGSCVSSIQKLCEGRDNFLRLYFI